MSELYNYELSKGREETNEWSSQMYRMLVYMRDKFKERLVGQARELQFHSIYNRLNWDLGARGYLNRNIGRYKMS